VHALVRQFSPLRTRTAYEATVFELLPHSPPSLDLPETAISKNPHAATVSRKCCKKVFGYFLA